MSTPTFTQKHYESLAEFVSILDEPDKNIIGVLLAGWLALDNERFDRDKWFKACKYSSEGELI